MSPVSSRLLALTPIAFVLSVLTMPAAANCFDPFNRQSTGSAFEFTTSKAAQVAPGEVQLTPTAYRDSFTLEATVSSSTMREVSGTKESHRSEILETLDSTGAANTGRWICYAWTMKLGPDMALPAAGSPRAKLTLAQFHQTSALAGKEPAVLFIDLDPAGNLVALFNEPVGKRSTVLVPGGSSGKDALGKTWEIVLSARWSTANDGRVVITMREKDKGAFVEVMNDTGQNATSGYVYQKLGVYRHNIERDPGFAATRISVLYSDIARNGVKASFRGLSGGLSPVTADATTTSTSGSTLGSATTSSSTSSTTSGSTTDYATVTTGNRKTPPARILKVTMGRGSGSGGRGMRVAEN